MYNFKSWLVFNKYWILLLSFIFYIGSASAVVNVEGTRVVFNEKDRVALLSLSNSEKQPTIVQLWLDEGDPTVSPEKIRTPIIVPTPVFDMKPREVRSAQLVLASRSSLPQDRESLYWLNIYQIPPNTKAENQAEKKVILPLRIRMKVFIRPVGVGVLQENDIAKLTFTLSKQGNGSQLVIYNPTPWHININGLTISGEKIESLMILPKSDYTIQLKNRPEKYQQATFNVINDFGNFWQYSRKLSY